MKKTIFAVIALVLLTGYASAVSEVSLVVPAQRINVNDTFDVFIYIDPKGEDISGAQANFLFNKSIIKVNSVLEGNLFSQYGANTYFFYTKIDNQSGIIHNIVGVVIGRYNISTQGTFAIVNITAISTGSSSLNLSNVKISSPEAQPVPLSTFNQSVNSYSISDINGDWTTDLLDIVSVSQHFGETTYYPYPSYDVNKDGIVDILDIILVARDIK